ncbi:MAG: hypothetical protein K6C36_00045 [Clostridia bacterium]|nr:hypothetical protein [Clostridia bacterium]
MKKNGIKGLKPAFAVALFCVVAVGGIGLRMYQMLYLIDPETGFFNDSSHPVVLALYALMGAGLLLIAAISAFCSGLPGMKLAEGRRIAAGVAALLCAAGFGYDAYAAWLLRGDDSLLTRGINTGSVTVPLIIQAVFGALSAVYFILYAAGCFAGGGLVKRIRALAVAPVIFEAARLIFRFTRTISFIKVAELLAELVGITLAMLFFMEHARASGEIAGQSTGRMLLFAGLGASAVMFAYSVPRLVLVLTGSTDLLVARSDFFPADLATAVFAIAFILGWLKTPKEKVVATEPLPAEPRA